MCVFVFMLPARRRSATRQCTHHVKILSYRKVTYFPAKILCCWSVRSTLACSLVSSRVEIVFACRKSACYVLLLRDCSFCRSLSSVFIRKEHYAAELRLIIYAIFGISLVIFLLHSGDFVVFRLLCSCQTYVSCVCSDIH